MSVIIKQHITATSGETYQAWLRRSYEANVRRNVASWVLPA